MRAWYRRGLSANEFVPRPDGTTAHACGPRPARVLIVGGAGPAIGWGVRSQELALSGHLARALAAATGRGVDVSVVADTELTLAGIPAALAREDLALDAAVVVTGVREAVTLHPVRAWRRELAALVSALRDACPRAAHLLIAGTPPVRSIPAFRRAGLGAVAARHGERLNRLSRELCEGQASTSFTRLPAPADPCEGRYRSPASYRQWADALAADLGERIAATGGSGEGARAGRRPEDDLLDGEPLCESDRCPRLSGGRDAAPLGSGPDRR
jgi:hypothetical protein